MKNRELKAEIFSLTHHAYSVMGGREAREELFKVLENSWGVATKANPDFSYQKFASLGIDEARNLKELQEKKSFALGGKKIFVVEADTITVEAQNSFLKMFEEPTANTYFFLLGHCVKNLIPTLASRVAMIKGKTAAPAAGAAETFLFLAMPERLAFVKKLSDDIKDEKKTKAEALALIHQIEDALCQKSKKDSALPPKILENVEKCRQYLGDRSAGVKMLLEYIALIA